MDYIRYNWSNVWHPFVPDTSESVTVYSLCGQAFDRARPKDRNPDPALICGICKGHRDYRGPR